MMGVSETVRKEMDEMAARWAEQADGVLILISTHEGERSELAYQSRGSPYVLRGMCSGFVAAIDRRDVVRDLARSNGSETLEE